MSIEHIVRCDALLTNGLRCETRAAAPDAHIPPPGWTTITRYATQTADNSPLMKQIAPLLDAGTAMSEIEDASDEKAKAKNEKAKAKNEILKGAMGNMFAGMIEGGYPVPSHGHICDKHELPKIQLTACGAHAFTA